MELTQFMPVHGGVWVHVNATNRAQRLLRFNLQWFSRRWLLRVGQGFRLRLQLQAEVVSIKAKVLRVGQGSGLR